MVNPALFSSSEYVQFRFGYPAKLFEPLRKVYSSCGFDRPIRVLDLGCGTGLVSGSFLKSVPFPVELHLMDVDASMLEEARKQFESDSRVVSVVCAPSESIPKSKEAFDLVMVGSAWHWMRQLESVAEIERILQPEGFVYIFEYQFPRAVGLPDLNEWIRVQFNSLWKPSTQVPRGSLYKLTECFRSHVGFSQLESLTMKDERSHDAAELAGVVISQSRYQHFEQSLPLEMRNPKRMELKQSLDEQMEFSSQLFSYPYEAYLFKKRR